jgi:hypothetical protein
MVSQRIFGTEPKDFNKKARGNLPIEELLGRKNRGCGL